MTNLFRTLLSVAVIAPFFTPLANAACIKDIYTAGVDLKSREYILTDPWDSEGSIVSKSAGGINASWIWWCPSSKLELKGTLGIERVELDLEESKAPDGRHVEDPEKNEYYLYRAVLNADRTIFKRFGLLGELGLRQDLLFSNQYDYELNKEVVTNFEIMIGLRYTFLMFNRANFSAYMMVGGSGPMGADDEENQEGGGVVKFGIHTLIKYKKNLSWEVDLQFKHHENENEPIKQESEELNLGLKAIFTL